MGKDSTGATPPSTDTLWQELNTAAVVHNKWTQRAMYTLQTDPQPLEGTVELQECIDAVKAATELIRYVCDEAQ